VIFNINFRRVSFHTTGEEPALHVLEVGWPPDSTINGMPVREMHEGEVVLPEVYP
jgi:hypothetical protein